MAAYRVARPLLFRADAERIHHAALHGLRLAGAGRLGRGALGWTSGVPSRDAGREPVELMGLRFRNRIGLGAGFDKDGTAIAGWAALGFGFIELGTVTPRPQPGSSRPRLFRLEADAALINRMGFNNAGATALAQRIMDARPALPDGCVIGVNIGRNRETPDDRAVDDYVASADAVAEAADYLAINVSSPNTPGLRDLQDPMRLAELLAAVRSVAPDTPLLVKLSSDLEPASFDRLVSSLADSSASGLILANTSTKRSRLRSTRRAEPGGLSGRPLADRTRRAVSRARQVAADRLVIVASGGIGEWEGGPAATWESGPDLVQVWTGLVYSGPGLIREALRAGPRRHRRQAVVR